MIGGGRGSCVRHMLAKNRNGFGGCCCSGGERMVDGGGKIVGAMYRLLDGDGCDGGIAGGVVGGGGWRRSCLNLLVKSLPFKVLSDKVLKVTECSDKVIKVTECSDTLRQGHQGHRMFAPTRS